MSLGHFGYTLIINKIIGGINNERCLYQTCYKKTGNWTDE